MKMNFKIKSKLLIVTVLAVMAIPFAIKFFSEHIAATKAADESKRAQSAYLIIVNELDQYVAKKGQCPASLKDLPVKGLPIGLDNFDYSCSNNVCAIVFHGKYIWFQHSLNYGNRN